MIVSDETFESRNTQLAELFDRTLRDRPDLIEEIPDQAVIVFQIKGDDKFNAWARQIAEDESPDRPRLIIEFQLKPSNSPTGEALSWDQIDEMKFQPA